MKDPLRAKRGREKRADEMGLEELLRADARALCASRSIDDVEMAQQLLEREYVATVPGSAFAIPGFIRMSYATSMEELEKAMPRLRSFAQSAS